MYFRLHSAEQPLLRMATKRSKGFQNWTTCPINLQNFTLIFLDSFGTVSKAGVLSNLHLMPTLNTVLDFPARFSTTASYFPPSSFSIPSTVRVEKVSPVSMWICPCLVFSGRPLRYHVTLGAGIPEKVTGNTRVEPARASC